ncbi:GNAT family N-acetyltransferase [Salimicrobium halophilum]|uniref:Ribosomal-protein-alanine N-acetyltransferase n=1 Tax=Salimicrobium halophilum TaxID=86666 RepID=A0A1G8RCY1_9BACI|nr:GNAT family N-acetyltransferase [Salimicrobium halophilum]SDJ14826.1 ribosomal-protein-alanine N-acetyltransferase [Salimicrobium halophilum]
MCFEFRPITIEYVKEISSWNYEGYVEEVIMTPYIESFEKSQELTGPGGSDGFVAFLNNETAGLFEFNIQGTVMEIGLALRPDLIGQGLGVTYVQQGLEFGLQYYTADLFLVRLSVDKRNEAAIRVYEKTGFRKVEENEVDSKMILPL